MISLGTAPMAHPTFRKGDRFLTRRLPRFQAAARAARRQQDKPYTSISLSKVSIDPCEMAYSTGQSEGHCVPMGTTVMWRRRWILSEVPALGICDFLRCGCARGWEIIDRPALGWGSILLCGYDWGGRSI